MVNPKHEGWSHELYNVLNYTSVTGDDWEHEEIFTDDDEAVGNDPEEREDLAPEVPAPPEIKQVSFNSTNIWELWPRSWISNGALFGHYIATSVS